MAIEGSLDLFRLPEILQVISQENKTGILTVQGERDIIAISFSSGRVVAADALNQTLEEALGDTLAREDLLARTEYEAAVAEQRNTGGRLIDVLVDRGYLDRSELLAGLRRHTSELLSEVLVWDEGDFKFYTNDEVSYEEGFEPISVESLLLANLKEHQPQQEPAEGEPADDREAPSQTLPRAEPSAPETPLSAPVPTRPSAPAQDAGPGASAEPVAVATPVARATPTPRRAPVPSRLARAGRAAPAWEPRLLGALAAVGVLLAFFTLASPRILLPLPGSDGPRAVLEQAHRDAWIDHVRDAFQTFHLLEGRLPETPNVLADRALLTTDALAPEFGTWEYEPGPGAFRLSLDGTTMERSTRGDFLLDPDAFVGSERLREPPLVLLD